MRVAHEDGWKSREEDGPQNARSRGDAEMKRSMKKEVVEQEAPDMKKMKRMSKRKGRRKAMRS